MALHADLVITGGHVVTVNASDDVAEAVAVAGDRIVAVGRAHDLDGLIGPRTDVIRLRGETVVPGFIDPHNHFMLYGQSFYPHHSWYWADRHVSTFIGGERASRMNPMKSAMRAGVVTVGHSDAPIAEIGDPVFGAEPLFGIWCAVNRTTRAGRVIGPEERVTPREGIRAFTINAAHASFEERLKGSIEAGKLADLAILERDPCAVDPWAIKDIRVVRTISGGRTVYEAG